MEVISGASFAMLVAICLILTTAFPNAMANVDVPVPAPAPSPTNDGTAIDQGIAYVLMLVALVLTYIIH